MREAQSSRRLCMLPAGTYWIGSDGHKNASPRHVRRFAGDVWLDCDLVTWLDFAGFVTGGGYADDAWWRTADDASFPETARPSSVDARCEAVRGLTLSAAPPVWTRPRGDLPLLGLTWFEAAAVCHFFNARLPFETEWEAATTSGLLNATVAGPVAQEWCLGGSGSRRRWPGLPPCVGSGSGRVSATATAAISLRPEAGGGTLPH